MAEAISTTVVPIRLLYPHDCRADKWHNQLIACSEYKIEFFFLELIFGKTVKQIASVTGFGYRHAGSMRFSIKLMIHIKQLTCN